MVKIKLIFVYIIISSINISTNAFSQGIKIGDTIVYETRYTLGRMKIKTYFIPSKINNYERAFVKEIEYYRNGQVKILSLFPNALQNDRTKNGTEYEWYKNGQLKSRIHYKNGEWDGVQRWWYKNGKLSSEDSYKNGVGNGLQISYDRNGRIVNFYTLKNDTLDGKTYSIDKSYSSRGYFINGTGADTLFYKNGKIHMIQFFNGKLTSDSSKIYDKKGDLISIERHSKDDFAIYTIEKFEKGKKVAIYYINHFNHVKTEQLVNGVWETEQYYYDQDGFMYKKTTSKGDEFFENKKKKKGK
jgi:antitoxin component YwqK of YwqJK toxin-antitoxin module